MADEILTSVTDGIATVTMNRPAQRNAMNGAMLTGMRQSFDELDDRKDVHLPKASREGSVRESVRSRRSPGCVRRRAAAAAETRSSPPGFAAKRCAVAWMLAHPDWRYVSEYDDEVDAAYLAEDDADARAYQEQFCQDAAPIYRRTGSVWKRSRANGAIRSGVRPVATSSARVVPTIGAALNP